MTSPESPGEDPYMSDRERVKSSSSTGSGRRSSSRSSQKRVREVRSDSAKRKTPEVTGAGRSHGGRSGGAKKRTKQNSPRKQDQERSRRHNENRRVSAGAGRFPVQNPPRPRTGTSDYYSNSERSSCSSGTAARSREWEAPPKLSQEAGRSIGQGRISADRV